MENNMNNMPQEGQQIPVNAAIAMVRDMLGNVSVPISMLVNLDPNQIMLIRNSIIGPVEEARRMLGEILEAYRLADEQYATMAGQISQGEQVTPDNIVEMPRPDDMAKTDGETEVKPEGE